jgi:uncharacterized coiled-coil DUF342 family protein
VFNDKLVKLQEILGLEFTMEKILDCKPNTKEFNNIKKLKETRSRADTLSTEMVDMERKLEQMQQEVDFGKFEINQMKQKHSKQITSNSKKLEELKEMYVVTYFHVFEPYF